MSRYWAFACLFLAVASAAFSKNLYIPVAGVAQGANNTRFRTDVRIFNPSTTTEIGVSIHFQPAGSDGSYMPGRVGALRLDSDTARSYEFVADSRTYTDSPNLLAPGTFGQFIPALDPSDAVRDVVVQHLSHSSDITNGFRTNAGAMNPGLDPATVTPRLYAADGALIAEGPTFIVPPRSVIHRSLPAMLARDAIDLSDGYLLLTSDVPVFGYGSVIDNRSGDQIFIPGAEIGRIRDAKDSPWLPRVRPRGLRFDIRSSWLLAGDTVARLRGMRRK